MNIMNQINDLYTANKEFGVTEEDNEILETAYIEILDYRELDQSLQVTTASTKRALLGSFKTKQTGESKKIKVQFNPTTLTFSASGSLVKIGEGVEPKEGKKGMASEQAPKIEFSIKLIFDRTIYIDPNVMPEVEGFLAIIKNPYTRQIIFHWGNLYYKGKLTSVNAEYTMFTEFGIPIRANIDLQMEVLV